MLAVKNAEKGKLKSYGVKLFYRNENQNIIDLHKSLKEGTFKTSPYSIFKIYEPKEREIYRLPFYPDRVVHHAIMNIMEPIWVSIFTNDTYACVKGKGIHSLVVSLKKSLSLYVTETKYCLKMDIRKFYPSIDNGILKSIIRKKIKDERLLSLLDNIIDSSKGVPIGNYLSQYFANLYLTYLDHWIKEVLKVRFYWRYADDMVLLSDSKEELWGWYKQIDDYLSSKLNLKIKDNYQVFEVADRGIDYVGYVFRHNYTRVRKGIKKNMFRKVHRLNNRIILPSPMEYKRAIASWYGWCKYCDGANLINKVINIIPYEIEFNK